MHRSVVQGAAPLHLSAELDYALRALVALATCAAQPSTAAEIAHTDMSVRFLHAILGRLQRAGILTSRRGHRGGYWLGRPAAEISVGDVVRALHRGGTSATARPGSAAIDAWWRTVDADVLATLDATSIAALAEGA